VASDARCGVFVNLANGGLVELAGFNGVADRQGRDRHYSKEYANEDCPRNHQNKGTLRCDRWDAVRQYRELLTKESIKCSVQGCTKRARSR